MSGYTKDIKHPKSNRTTPSQNRTAPSQIYYDALFARGAGLSLRYSKANLRRCLTPSRANPDM